MSNPAIEDVETNTSSTAVKAVPLTNSVSKFTDAESVNANAANEDDVADPEVPPIISTCALSPAVPPVIYKAAEDELIE